MRCCTYKHILRTIYVCTLSVRGLGTVCQLIAVNFPLRLPIEINLQICTRAHPHPSRWRLWLSVCFEFIFICIWIWNHSLFGCPFASAVGLFYNPPPRRPATPRSLSLCLFVCLLATLCGTFKVPAAPLHMSDMT